MVTHDRRCLSALGASAARLLKLRAGVAGHEAHSAAATAQLLSLSSRRETQLEQAALAALSGKARGGCPPAHARVSHRRSHRTISPGHAVTKPASGQRPPGSFSGDQGGGLSPWEIILAAMLLVTAGVGAVLLDRRSQGGAMRMGTPWARARRALGLTPSSPAPPPGGAPARSPQPPGLSSRARGQLERVQAGSATAWHGVRRGLHWFFFGRVRLPLPRRSPIHGTDRRVPRFERLRLRLGRR